MSVHAMPSSIQDRVCLHRSRLGDSDIELEDVATIPTLAEGTTSVFLAGILPASSEALRETFTRMRREFPAGIVVRVVDEERPLRTESAARRLVGRLRSSSSAPREASVVEALRDTGWTVGSIERIELDDEPSRLWIDLTAVDLSTITAGSGEGDRDQRSE